MFAKGDRIHLHDGSVVTMKRPGVPKLKRQPGEMPRIRGFVRGQLVDSITGEVQTGEWHENVITTYGHGMVIKNFVGLAGSSHASYWAIGYHAGVSSNFSTASAFDATEWNLSSGSNTGSRATVSAGQQTLSGTWTLAQSYQYVASNISHAASVNAVAQYAHGTIGSGSALSLATFPVSTKASTVALNVTYNWLFSVVFAGIAVGLEEMLSNIFGIAG